MKNGWMLAFAVIFLTGCTITGNAISEFEPIELPAPNVSGADCVKDQSIVVLKYYFPEKNYTREQIDELVGGTQKWTWFSQAFKALSEEGLDVEYYSMSPYDKITRNNLGEIYGENIGETVLGNTNWEPFEESLEFLKNNPKYHYEKLDWSDIEREFSQGNLVILIVDTAVLGGNEQIGYNGHAVTITSVNDTHVSMRANVAGPDWVRDKQNVINAWNAKGTDNDALIISGIAG